MSRAPEEVRDEPCGYVGEIGRKNLGKFEDQQGDW